jgi:uncharacterized RDD family membrane protein YckC
MSGLSLGVRYGGLARRGVAFLVDFAAEAVIVWPIGFGMSVALGINGTAAAGQIAIVAGLIFDSFYFTLFESSSLQGTSGKLLLGMRVTHLEGERISVVRAGARYLGKALSAILLMAGFLRIVFHPRKQGLHDVLARTVVVRRPFETANKLVTPAASRLVS